MIKKIFAISFIVICVVITCACEKSSNNETNKETNNTSTEKIKCYNEECVDLLTLDDSIETINDKLGVKGKQNQFVTNAYDWILSDEMTLRTYYNADGKATKIQLVYDYEYAKNDNLIFDTEALMHPKNYADAVSITGGEGTLLFIEKSYGQYLWYKNNECYVRILFWNNNKNWAGSDGAFKNC